MKKPKHAVAVLIRNGDQILITRRPNDDDEFPGVWGIPAGTFQSNETLEDVVRRIGRQKLNVELTPLRQLKVGTQDRPGYFLQMELWEVQMAGDPDHPEWAWAAVERLSAGQAQGSLCCDLALAAERKSRISG